MYFIKLSKWFKNYIPRLWPNLKFKIDFARIENYIRTKSEKRTNERLLVILSEMLRIPRVCEHESLHVLELVCAIVDGSAHTVRAFPGGA